VPNPDQDELIRKPAGERIVAFARPGKPPGNRFFQQYEWAPIWPMRSIRAGFATAF
jgi:hypothetical protein